MFMTGITSNYSDDYPYSWSAPAYHASTQRYWTKKVGENQARLLLQQLFSSGLLSFKDVNQLVYTVFL